jgi:hypothetical protein
MIDDCASDILPSIHPQPSSTGCFRTRIRLKNRISTKPSDVTEAVEAAITFTVGGFTLLLIGSAVESSSIPYNLSVFSLFTIRLGIVRAIGLVATISGGLLRR